MCSPGDGSAERDGGKRGAAERHRLMKVEDDGEGDAQVGGSSHRSCVHIEVPLMFWSSTLVLDRPLFISFTELGVGPLAEPVLFRSSLSLRLGVSPRHQPTRGGEGQVGQQPGGCTVQRTLPASYGAGGDGDPDPRRHGNALGLSSLGRPKPSNATTGGQKENTDEFRRQPLTPNPDPGMNFITSPLKWQHRVSVWNESAFLPVFLVWLESSHFSDVALIYVGPGGSVKVGDCLILPQFWFILYLRHV